jgi:hypothetical protein
LLNSPGCGIFSEPKSLPGAFRRRHNEPGLPTDAALFILFTQQLAGRAVDKMQFSASLADYGFMSNARWVIRRIFEPMLHV